MFFIILFVYVINYMLLYIILLYRFDVFVGGSIHWSNTIELAVQPVFNGWTNEPVNRWPHRFNIRSGPNNYDPGKAARATPDITLIWRAVNCGGPMPLPIYSLMGCGSGISLPAIFPCRLSARLLRNHDVFTGKSRSFSGSAPSPLVRRRNCRCFTVGFSEGYPEKSGYE